MVFSSFLMHKRIYRFFLKDISSDFDQDLWKLSWHQDTLVFIDRHKTRWFKRFTDQMKRDIETRKQFLLHEREKIEYILGKTINNVHGLF